MTTEQNIQKRILFKPKYAMYIAVILLQLIGVLYWANMKQNYYIDELFSYQFASNFTWGEDTALYLTMSDEWKEEEWISNAGLKKQLCISDAEAFSAQPLPTVLKLLSFKKTYHGLLNMAHIISHCHTLNKWPGIVLNLLFLLISDLLLIILFKRLRVRNLITCLALLMLGLSSYFLSLNLYIRFYLFSNMLALAMILLLHISYKAQRFVTILLAELGAFLCAFFSLLNAEYTLIFAVALFGLFFLFMLIRKEWLKVISFIPVGAGTFAYLLLKTKYIDMLFHLDRYMASAVNGSMEQEVAQRILMSSPWTVLEFLRNWLLKLFIDSLFGHLSLFIAWAVLLIAMIVWAFKTGPHFMNVWRSEDGPFVILLVCTTGIFFLFAGIAYVSTSRYMNFGMLTFLICFWICVDRMLGKMGLRSRRVFSYVLTLLAIACITAPLITRNVDFIYEEDRDFVETIAERNQTDTILICRDKSPIGQSESFDAVSQLDDQARLYITTSESVTRWSTPLPKEFLIWTINSRDLTSTINQLKTEGYSIESLGCDHISQVYYCKAY